MAAMFILLLLGTSIGSAQAGAHYLANFTLPGTVEADPMGFGSPPDLPGLYNGLYYSGFQAIPFSSFVSNGSGYGNGIAAHSPLQSAIFGYNLSGLYLDASCTPGRAAISANFYSKHKFDRIDLIDFWFGCTAYNASHHDKDRPGDALFDPSPCTLVVKGYHRTDKRVPAPTETPDATATFKFVPQTKDYPNGRLAKMVQAVLPTTFANLLTVSFEVDKGKQVSVDDIQYIGRY